MGEVSPLSKIYIMHVIAAIIGTYWIFFRIPTIIRKKRKKKPIRTKKLEILGEAPLYLSIAYLVCIVIYGYYYSGSINLVLFLIGAPVYIVGAILNEYSRFVLGEQWSGPAIIIKDHRLIRSGPYGIVRHPMYLANIAMYVSAGMMVNCIIGIILSLLVFVPLFVKRALVEENELEKTFGNTYRDYKKNVPMFIPFTKMRKANKGKREEVPHQQRESRDTTI